MREEVKMEGEGSAQKRDEGEIRWEAKERHE